MSLASPVTALTSVAIVADDTTSDWLAGLLAASPREAYLCRRGDGFERRKDEAGEPDVFLLDVRQRDGAGRAMWRRLEEAARDVAVVLLVDTAEQESGDAEALPIDRVTTAELDRAIRHSRRVQALRAEARTARDELTARIRMLESLDAERVRQQRLLQGILESLPLLIGRIDRSGRVLEAHGTLARGGFAAEHWIGRKFAQVVPQARAALRQALDGQPSSFSLRGREGPAEWHAEVVLLPDAADGPGVIFLARDVSERRWLEQQLLTAADAEQKRIGADLHDGLGQQLTGLACLATALRDRLREAGDPALASQADFIAEVANDATRQSRALARGLCPVQLEGATIESALADLTYQAQQLHGITCRFRARRHSPPLDHFTAIHLYRITQEALHNAVRHGKARNVRVTLVSCGPRHRLTVTDDGRGFDPRQPALAACRGLRLMHYRAGMIGGTLTLQSRPGNGTRIHCNFSHFSAPLHEDQR